MELGRCSAHRRRLVAAASRAAVCGASAFALACDSNGTTPPFGSSRATVAGRISASGAALSGVSVSPVIYHESGCTGPELPVTLQPPTVVSGADGGYSVRILANGFSSFGGCVRLTLRRPEGGATATVTKAPVTFVEVDKGQPVTTQFDITWP